MNNVKFEVASEKDASEIYLIDSDYEYECYSLDSIKDSLKAENNLNLIARINNDAVGYISFSSVLDEAELLKIVIKKNYRRKGIGKLLLKEAIQYLKARGLKTVFLEVRKSNCAAIVLYENMGFEKINERQNYYGIGEDANIYRLSLE